MFLFNFLFLLITHVGTLLNKYWHRKRRDKVFCAAFVFILLRMGVDTMAANPGDFLLKWKKIMTFLFAVANALKADEIREKAIYFFRSEVNTWIIKCLQSFWFHWTGAVKKGREKWERPQKCGLNIMNLENKQQ